MRQSKKIAVTGGIGSGKTELLKIFGELGYPVASCDDEARKLWQDEEYRAHLARLFPSCVKDGKVEKTEVSALVFSDEKAREKLNAFSHPYILNRVLHALSGELCFAEVPLLFEGGYEAMFDGVIAVRRKKEKRLVAVQKRSGLTEREIELRMNAQFDADLLETKNCFIVENDGTLDDLRTRAKELIALFLA